MSLKNLSLLWKLNSLLGILGIFAIGAIALTGSQISLIGGSYASLIGGEIEAAKLIASANRDLAWTERSLLQLIWSTSEETNKQFMQEMNEAGQHFLTTMAAAQKSLPAKTREFQAFINGFDRIFKQECAVAAQMGSESTTLEGNSKAMAEMNRACAKSLATLSSETTILAGLLGSQAAKTETALQLQVHNTIVSTYVVVFAGFAAILIAAAFLTRKGVIRPIKDLIASMTVMANGTLNEKVPGTDRHDELGTMAKAIEVFRVGLAAAEDLRAKAEHADRHAATSRRQAMQNLANQFESAVGEIIETVSSSSAHLEIAAHSLTRTAADTQRLTALVSAASGEASANVQSVASSGAEMAASVSEIGHRVRESARIADRAVGQAKATNDRVNALSQAATRISEVVELINTIASQTNLLALNATIEAARAGESGRGFAVVASEVKTLAGQTARATGEISEQIAGIQAATHESVVAIQEIGETILQISEIVSAIASSVEEQGIVTQEISRKISQAADGARQVDSNISDVRRGATETGSASSQVLCSVQSLSAESRRLKLEVGKFLGTVRVA